MGRLYRGQSRTIAARHFSSFFLLIAAPTFVVILFSGYLFRQEIVRLTTEQRYGALEQTASGIESGLQEFSLIASALVHDRSLMDKTLEYVDARTDDRRYVINFSLDSIFNRYFILTKQLGAFHVIFSDGSGPYVCRNFAGIRFSRNELDTIAVEGSRNPGFVQILDTIKPGAESYSDRPVVSLVINPARSADEKTGIRSLFLSFDLSELADFIDQRNDVSRNNGKYVSCSTLVGRNGLVLASSDHSLVGKDYSAVKKTLGRKFLIIERRVDASQWTIVEAINLRTLTQNVDRFMLYTYLAIIIISALFLWYNTLFFAQIVNPIKAIVREMDTVAKGNFSARVEPCEFQELNKLGDAFNLMVAEIDLLTAEIKSEQKERLKAEIEALRYQLNPHFLCNTLNSIRMMATIAKNDAIKKMTSALMTITEDNLGRDDMVYSLARELRNIDSYVYIMKVRYGDSFDFFKDVDSSLLALGVPSMILQPLVENAILHGLHGLPRPGAITVAASRDEDSLRIEVRDNGFGMTAERVERVFDEASVSGRGLNRIGLYNVRRRLLLLYGGKYDVQVSSYPGEGTVVLVTLPILSPPDEGESRGGEIHD
jgi:two-component system sensor histidine kinase YesM